MDELAKKGYQIEPENAQKILKTNGEDIGRIKFSKLEKIEFHDLLLGYV